MLKLMYITDNEQIALAAEEAGIDRIFVDMEYVGKDVRQAGLDSVKNHHTLEDVQMLRTVLTKSELLVRCNPIHRQIETAMGSEAEIDALCHLNPDIIMLPYFKSANEVEAFIELVGGRTRTMLLVETKEAMECIDEILRIPGIDEVYIGLNDLSISLGMDFMFQTLSEGYVESLCEKFKEAGLPFGFGGIGRIGEGLLPAHNILKEHYRLGSSSVILSRSFCNVTKESDVNRIKTKLLSGVSDIREFEHTISSSDCDFEANRQFVIKRTSEIAQNIRHVKTQQLHHGDDNE